MPYEMSIQMALLRHFAYKLSSLVAKKIKSKALAADWSRVRSSAMYEAAEPHPSRFTRIFDVCQSTPSSSVQPRKGEGFSSS